jgi:uncharacterized cupin superfamily protein
MKIFNLHGDEWDETTEHEGFGFKDGWVGARIGAELIGGSLYEVAPGKKLWPYHIHHANEEWAIVVSGRPILRTTEGERELTEGDVACFRRGPAARTRSSTEPRSLCACSCSRPESLRT